MSAPLNIVFMGTPDFATVALRALAGGGGKDRDKNEDTDKDGRYAVKLVFTRPDAASGRGKTLLPSPVKACAEELAIPAETPRTFYAYSANPERTPLFDKLGKRVVDAEWLAHIAATRPDFIVVAAYGMILPQEVLDLPRYGCVNIHASLLPRWRGAAPIQRALLAGDAQAGVSIMRMEAGLDTGAYCAVAATPTGEKGAATLTVELAGLGAELLLEALPRIADGTATWTEQDDTLVTYADKLEKSELYLDPSVPALTNIRRVRASTPQIPARCLICGKPVTVLECGEGAESGGLILETVDGTFGVTMLKPDGKKAMPAAAFAAGVKELQKGGDSPVSWQSIGVGRDGMGTGDARLGEKDCHCGLEPQSRGSIAGGLRVLHDDLQVHASQNSLFTQSDVSGGTEGRVDRGDR